MTGSNAKIIIPETKKICRTVRRKKRDLIPQKLTGAAMLIFITLAAIRGGSVSAAVILAPMAFAAIFSKEKLIDFRIFAGKPPQ